LNAREPPVAVKERDLVDELVAGMAEPGRQSLRLALLGRIFQRRERLEQFVRLDLVPGFRWAETDRLEGGRMRLRFGGAPPAHTVTRIKTAAQRAKASAAMTTNAPFPNGRSHVRIAAQCKVNDAGRPFGAAVPLG